MNSFGNIFRVTSFGESHGIAIGGVIDGMPAGVPIDIEAVQHQLNRRRPGQSELTTQRSETDSVEFLSGIYNGVSTGTPIGFIIRNCDHRSEDYSDLSSAFRPNHADYTYYAKYGIRDARGGGRSSARETAIRVVAGAIALQALKILGINIWAYTSGIGKYKITKHYSKLNPMDVDSNPVRCPDGAKASRMMSYISKLKESGNTVGGTVSCIISGVPAGLGEPVGNKLQAELAAAMMSINAAKGFEYGLGFKSAEMLGDEVLDLFTTDSMQCVHTISNFSGGIQGGISNGEDIYFKVAFKPVATLLMDIPTINDSLEPIVLRPRGRHDYCVVPRAVPVVEAMAAITIFDAYLRNKSCTFKI